MTTISSLLSARKRRKRRFVRLNKNFCNYPIARDPRTQAEWRPSRRPGWIFCPLPGDPRIRLYAQEDVDPTLLHCPTAFDMNVLFLLLSEAQTTKCTKIEFKSIGAALKALGLAVDSANRNRLAWSFHYWHCIQIEFSKWYKSGGGHVRNELSPPIADFSLDHGVTADISLDWFASGRRYYEKVPIPLPSTPVAQNTVLQILVSIMKIRGELQFSKRPDIEVFCAKTGLFHSRRNQAIASVLKGPVSAWFRKIGITVDPTILDEELRFFVSKIKRSTQPMETPASEELERRESPSVMETAENVEDGDDAYWAP